MRTTKIKVAWLAPYPVQQLSPPLTLARPAKHLHACSWIVNLSAALAQRAEIDLHVVTEASLVARSQVVHVGNITFHVVKTGVPMVHRGFPFWMPLDLLTGFRWNARRLAREIRAIGPDLVHAHGTEAAYGMAGLESGYPCLISMQGIITEYQQTDPCWRYRVVQHFEQAQVRRGRYFGCRTTLDSQFVRRYNPTARIFTLQEVMHPVYFANEWQVRPEETLLYVGSEASRKGLDTLLQSLKIIAEHRQKTRLQVVGCDPSPSLRRRCLELGIGARVSFLGFCSSEQIAHHHLDAQIFVLPSHNENSPNALAEAMVTGLPVIATAVGGIPSMVQDGENGLLVPAGNPARLAEAIIHLLDHPEERARLGRNARTAARSRHGPATVVEATQRAYREILQQSTSPVAARTDEQR